MPLQYLADLWDESHARTLDPPALLRYRSNLLGSDLRITNYGGIVTALLTPDRNGKIGDAL